MRNVSGSLTYLLLYVDDIMRTRNDSSYIDTLVHQLKDSFDMSDLGCLTYFLGLEVQRKSSGNFVTHTMYTKDLLTRFGMAEATTCNTPSSTEPLHVDSSSCSPADATAYRSMVGALHYLTFTCLDISFVVSRVSQYMYSPTIVQLTAVKQILRYLRGTLSLGLHFHAGSLLLSAFSDSGWAGSPIDRRFTTGFVLFLGPNPVSWVAKKQTTVSWSSTKAEYRALAATTVELLWVSQLLNELFVSVNTPTLYCDNQFALPLARNPVFHGRTKHIEVDLHFVRERVASKSLFLQFLSTDKQPTDLFTKPLTADWLYFLRHKLMPLAFV